MKITSLFTAVLLALVSYSSAQTGEFEINSIAPAVIRTPEFTFQGDQRRVGRAENWLEIEVEFSAKPDFTDELTFNYFVLFADKLLTGQVTHMAIPKGRELRSVMYVSPRSLSRLLDGKQMTANAIQNIAVQLTAKGQVLAEKSYKESRGQWWTTMQQIPGLLLNKSETPFAPLYWDRYEAIKPTSR